MSSDDRLLRIENKLDKIEESCDHINVTLAAQHVSLKEHMRRTSLLEQKIGPLEKTATIARSHVKLVLKLGAALTAIAGIVGVIIAILEYVKK